MKRLAVFVLTMIATSVGWSDATKTSTIKFSYWERHSLYACSYVEGRAQFFAKKLGATNVEVDCKGGLPHNDWVQAEITFSTPANSEERTTKIRINEACDFNQKLLEKMLPAFEPSEVVRKGVCWDSQGRLRYTITH